MGDLESELGLDKLSWLMVHSVVFIWLCGEVITIAGGTLALKTKSVDCILKSWFLTIFHAKKFVLRVRSDLEKKVKVWKSVKIAIIRREPNRLEIGVDIIIWIQISRVLLMLQYSPRTNVNSVSRVLPSD